MRWFLWCAVVGCGRVAFDPTADAAPDGSIGCAAPYVTVDGGCFRFVSTPAPWLAAEQDCEDDATDAHLVVIATVAEHFTIHAMTPGVPDVWLGYTDRVTEARVAWVTDGGLDPTSNPCFFGATVNALDADCVTQNAATSCGDWFYRRCGESHAYVCERDGSRPDSMTY